MAQSVTNVFRSIWLLLAACWAVNSESMVTFSQGGYDSIVVAFHNKVPQPSNCPEMLHNLEVAFQSASSFLYEASERRAYFRSVTVLLPPSWDRSACARNFLTAKGETYAGADFRIGLTHPLFGDNVWTQQSKGCGQQGDYVHLTSKFFRDLNETNQIYGDSGKTLVHEWAKYRYGVFDEFGFPGDKMYPTYYRKGNTFKPTGCSNVPIQGSPESCDPNVQNCRFTALGNNENVKSSIMYLHHLSNVSQFCDADTHQEDAPTKHNILCNGRSTKEVIVNHVDFASPSLLPSTFTPILFLYKQPANPRYVLALDRGGVMDERDNWKFLRIACRRFILQDVPDGTQLGVLSFTSSVQFHTENTTTLNNAAIREAVASGIPDFFPESRADKCLECAVKEAIRMLELNGGSAAGNVIILVTSGSSSSDQVAAALARAKQKRVHISVIAYASNFEGQELLTQETGGLLATVPNRGVGEMSHISMLIALGDALLAIAQYHHSDTQNLPVLIHEQEFKDSTRSWVNGSFVLDPSLGRETLFAVYFYSRDNTHVGDVKLTAPDGTEYRGKSEDSMASHYFTPLVAIDKPGVWTYSFDRRSQSHQSHFVKVTSKPRSISKGAITARIWRSPNLPRVNATYTPITLYAEVKMGDLPVLDARVKAVIRNLDLGNQTYELDLTDDGTGDPDITKGDGIYSRYLTQFNGIGSYSITLYAHAMDGRAYTIKTSYFRGKRSANINDDTSQLCCGSVINVPQELKELTGPFTRISPASVLTITGVPNPNVDTIPPNRISNFRAEVVKEIQRINFFWTAPGNDYDSGVAYGYELRVSPRRSDLNEHNFHLAEPIKVLELPKISGTPTQYTIEFQRYDEPYYFAIRAKDQDNNVGKISNIVEIYMPSPPTTLPPPPETTTALPGASTTYASEMFIAGLGTAELAGIVAGACVGLLLLILIIYLAICGRRRNKKTSQDKLDSSAIKSPPPKFAYIPPVYSDVTKMADKPLGGGAPLPSPSQGSSSSEAYKAPMTPVDQPDKRISVIYDTKSIGTTTSGVPIHWSATQLLEEHEKRHSPYGRSIRGSHAEPYAYDYNSNPGGMSAYHSTSADYALNPYGSIHDSTNNEYVTYGAGQRGSTAGYYPQRGSLTSTPPSDSFSNSDGAPRHYGRSEYEGDENNDLNRSYASNNNNNQSAKPAPPPTMPKPKPRGTLGSTMATNANLQGSFTSLASERKKQRNVTQV